MTQSTVIVRTPPPPDGPEPGLGVFGKYQLLRKLAVGGMAEVYVARSASLGGVRKTCVIKRILPEYSQDRQFVSMFIDEARILIGLSHHNVVRLYDFGQVDGSYYMALEYVAGCNLVSVLQQLFGAGQGMEPVAATFVAREVCEGLHHAHQQKDSQGQLLNIVHRDVSPHNVLVSRHGEVKVADFGIAQARGKMALTMPGTVLGKFAYMAPEQALGSRVDARADVFAVGVLLHESLVGQRLFAGGTPAETIGKLINVEPPPPSRMRAGIPNGLDDVVATSLHKNVNDRYQSAAQMADALSRVLTDAGGYGHESFKRYLGALNVPELLAHGDVEAAKGRTAMMHAEGTGARKRAGTLPAGMVNSSSGQDARVRELARSFREDPNVWTLAAIGTRLREQGADTLAASAYRVASGLFAYQGLLVQALVVHDRAGGLISEAQWEEDLKELWKLPRDNVVALELYMDRVDAGGFFKMLREGDLELPAEGAAMQPGARLVPMFGAVNDEHLVHLMKRARVRTYPSGTLVVREGDTGDTLYAIGEGRVVVWCSAPESLKIVGGRINLSSLTEGDFFGEFGFLAGEPRSANVETVGDTWVLEVDRRAVKDLMAMYPQIGDALMDFYKIRVVELLMARNAVFALLSPDDRRSLLAKSNVCEFEDDDIIIEENTEGDAFFFIKRGEVEIFSERSGLPVFINKLREGEFFGEIAAIKRVPRTASVRAMGKVELLRISGSDLQELLDAQPHLRKFLDEAIVRRVKEAQSQIKSAEDLFR